VKTTLRRLPDLTKWISDQNWKPDEIDLVVMAGHLADFDLSQIEGVVDFAVNNQLPSPQSWRSVTLASSAAPRNYTALPVGRTEVPRLDWQLWNAIIQSTRFTLDYGDYGISHPDLTDPPGIAMARASVSVRYSADDSWIILKGTATTGARGRPMDQQYLAHARTLIRDPQFGGLQNCAGDDRIQLIACQSTGSGNRTTWVEIGVNRHISLVTARLP
jgi:hypothetical protein